MRIEGWERLLDERLSRAREGAFAWGERDCALWCAEWVLECTGKDLGAAWRGKYATERGAARLMRKRGFTGVADIASDSLEEIGAAFARRGDVLLDARGCLGLCAGRRGLFLAEGGLTSRDTLDCPRAWRVG